MGAEVSTDECNGCRYGMEAVSVWCDQVFIHNKKWSLTQQPVTAAVCAAPFAEDAITLLPRETVPEAAGVW